MPLSNRARELLAMLAWLTWCNGCLTLDLVPAGISDDRLALLHAVDVVAHAASLSARIPSRAAGRHTALPSMCTASRCCAGSLQSAGKPHRSPALLCREHPPAVAVDNGVAIAGGDRAHWAVYKPAAAPFAVVAADESLAVHAPARRNARCQTI